MSRPWSKLQRDVYRVIAPEIKFQLQCRAYPMHAQYGSNTVPRYWIILGKEIIWDYPKHFVNQEGFFERYLPYPFPYAWDVTEISHLLKEYLDTPRSELLSKPFEEDLWGIINILRAADRRVGSRQWDKLEQRAKSEVVTKIIALRKALRNGAMEA